MLPSRLQLSLFGAQLVGVATLLRSIAFDRWITVLASLLLILGATAARRGRSWGVALALASAAAFPVAWMIGIAPAWFCLVGLFGALPFALTWRDFARFDRRATALLVMLATSGGAFGALLWKQIAWPLFVSFPALRPSLYPHHGLLLVTVVGVIAALGSRSRRDRELEETRTRIATPVRVALGGDADVLADRSADLAVEDHEVLEPRRAQRAE